jgi:myo-inositol 2-dehydrogenase / D-chiro-inositol 1-dehydrogenase
MSEPTVSRRDFVAATAAVAGGLAFNAGLYAQGKHTMKVGLVGCGGRGKGAVGDVLNADSDVQIMAFCDVFEDRAKAAMAGFKNDKKFGEHIKATPETCYGGLDGYKKLINNPDVNYVILATPPGFRPYHLEEAVNAGKNIFCEKPVAVDVAGILRVQGLLKKAEEKKLKIAAGTQRRHDSNYMEMPKRVHDGLIGDLTSARAYWNGNGIWFNARQKGMSDARYQLHNWYHFLWLCGDHICEQHVHNLDVMNWAFKTHPIRATGMGGRSNRKVGDPAEVGHIFDHFAVEFEYPNGVIVQSYCRQIEGTAANVSEALVGTKGRITTQGGFNLNGKPFLNEQGTRPYVQEHADLIRAIRDDAALNELENVMNSTMTAILGRMTTYSGKSITWKDALTKPEWREDTMPKNLTLDMDLPVDPIPVVGKWKPKLG